MSSARSTSAGGVHAGVTDEVARFRLDGEVVFQVEPLIAYRVKRVPWWPWISVAWFAPSVGISRLHLIDWAPSPTCDTAESALRELLECADAGDDLTVQR